MDEWIDTWTQEETGKRTHGEREIWQDGLMDGWMGVGMNGKVDYRGAWMEG